MTPAARRVEATATKQRAVIYLRVSTRDQAKRGGEAEGFSIPAQREACLRKAEALGAEVIGEYVDAGESARSANRPNLKRMLASIQREPIDYVIVHELAHLLEGNHTPRFWNVVRTRVPRMEQARAWLTDNGQLLEEEI